MGTADRFLLDVMLGKLATYLRMCGYDAAYALDRGIEDQLRELRAAGVPLSLPDRPRRCSACNGRLEHVGDADNGATDRPAHVPGVDAYRCRDCGQWFWKGSHWEDVRETLAAL